MRKNIILILVAVLVIAGLVVVVKNRNIEPGNNVIGNGAKSATSKKTPQSSTPTKVSSPDGTTVKEAIKSTTETGRPEIEFIDKRTVVEMKNYQNVDLVIEKVAFGRGDAAISTGCNGLANSNFSTYLYPGSGICISAEKVDGKPRGIVAFHILVENNSNNAFGGVANTIRLHYLGLSGAGKTVHRLAYPISSLASYSIQGYSSRQIILSYLVPEDVLSYDLLFDYSGSASDISENPYQFSTGGLFVDFKNKNISLVK